MAPRPGDDEALTEDELQEMSWAYGEVDPDGAARGEEGGDTDEKAPYKSRSIFPHPLRLASRLVSHASQRQSHFDNVEILLDRRGDAVAEGNVSVHEFRTQGEGRSSLRGELLGPKERLRSQLKSTEQGFFLRFSNGRVSPAVLDGETLVVLGDSPFVARI